jgi:hypothetical protein
MTSQDDRRYRPRYPLRAFAQLGKSDKEWAAHVLDISFAGARVALLEDYHLCAGDSVQLRLEIPEMYSASNHMPYLHLQGTLVHQQGHMLGLQYEPESDRDADVLRQLIDSLNIND